MNSEQNPGDSLSADKAAEEIRKVCAALSAEIEDLKKEIQQLREKKVLFESLLGECIRHHYYDEAACSPSWLEQARKATGQTN